MRMLGFAALCLAAFAPPALAQDCLRYGQPVQMEGFVLRGMLPGRPNFEDVRRGDERLPLAFLLLPTPVCIAANPTDPQTQPALPMVQVLMIGWRQPPGSTAVDAMEGHAVAFRGRLAEGLTAGQRTPVWLEAAEAVR
jgi:hypothetical protein